MTNKKQKYDDIILMQFADNELDKKTYKQLEEDLKTNNELQKRLSVYTLTRSALKNKENYQIPEKLNKLINQSVENKKILRFVKKHHFQFFPASVNFTLVIVFFGVLASLIAPIIKNNLNNDILFATKQDISEVISPLFKVKVESSLQSLSIYSLLKPGMSKTLVISLIGPPDKIIVIENGDHNAVTLATSVGGNTVSFKRYGLNDVSNNKIIVIEKNKVSTVINEWNYSYNAQKESGVWILKFIGETLLEITKKVYSYSK
jgi:hypothetical protein